MQIVLRKLQSKTTINDNETKRLSLFQSRKSAQYSLSGYVLLKEILKEKGYEDITIIREPHQKPYLKDIPLYFSISHSGAYVVCVVDEEEMGIDIQIQTPKLLHVRRRTGEVSEDIEILTKNWAIKEAYIKYIGNPKIPLKDIIITDKVTYKEPAHYVVIKYEDYMIALVTKKKVEVSIDD